VTTTVTNLLRAWKRQSKGNREAIGWGVFIGYAATSCGVGLLIHSLLLPWSRPVWIITSVAWVAVVVSADVVFGRLWNAIPTGEEEDRRKIAAAMGFPDLFD